MPLTPLDIESRRFRRQLFGFRRSEVESFLQSAADALSQAVLDREEQVRSAQAAREDLTQYREREKALIEALGAAERLSEEQREKAREEADRIVADAQRRSDEMIRHTQEELARVEKQILRLKVERESFESRLNALLDEHRRMLELRRQELGVAEQIRARTARPPASLDEDEAARLRPVSAGEKPSHESGRQAGTVKPHDHE
jgi:cell division initiation protein